MDKYRASAEKKLKGPHPDLIAKDALLNAEFSAREREAFFGNVYGDLMVDYFIQWLKTDPHETKSREFIYNSVLALGDVKQRMISYETLGRNVTHLSEDKNE